MALYLDTTIHTGRVSLRAARACIKSETFDLGLLILPLATGLAAAAAVLSNPQLFAVLLLADLWLLGYHHVVATYTRLAFGTDAFRRNRFLAFDLLLVMTVVTLALAFTAGAWVVASAFLYLQWFHYMRQGYGLSRMYFRATPEGQVAVFEIAPMGVTTKKPVGSEVCEPPQVRFEPPAVRCSVRAL
jgi:hypothetical protein